jgi:hypothetical protein
MCESHLTVGVDSWGKSGSVVLELSPFGSTLWSELWGVVLGFLSVRTVEFSALGLLDVALIATRSGRELPLVEYL